MYAFGTNIGEHFVLLYIIFISYTIYYFIFVVFSLSVSDRYVIISTHAWSARGSAHLTLYSGQTLLTTDVHYSGQF